MKSVRGKRRISLALGLLFLLIIFLYAHLFRGFEENNETLGIIVHKYRWGRPHKIEIDVNRDGTIDGKYILSYNAKDFSGPLKTGWQSSRCDSFFDVYMEFDPNGDLAILGYDNDRDGNFEQRFLQVEAQELLTKQKEPCGGFKVK